MVCQHYELAAFQTADMGLVKQYLNDHAPKGEKPAVSEQAQDFFSNSIDPLQIEGDFSQLLEKNEETDELEQDVFETDEEYVERIASLPKVHLGYAILDTRRQDGYTKIVFPLHHIDRNDRIHFSNNIRAFYAEDITGDDVIDDELVGGLRVFDGQVYCNYSTIVLKHGNEEIPLHPICWEKFPYETNMDLQHRIAQMPVLPLGLCMPDRNSYDLYTQTLTFAIKPFVYVKEKLTSSSINLEIDRDVAKELCAQSHPYKLFGQFKNNDVSFILWDKELGVFYTDSEEMQRYRNNPNSMGYMYAHGRGVKRDYKKAMEWYQKAANQGDADAQNSMGDLYYWGRGVLRDYKEAMKWYRKAAEQGNTDAQYKIGNLYCFGQGVMTDYQEAMKWYRKAADQDSADAQNIIGYLYECGNGVEQDYQEALKWYRKASEHGNDSAKRKLVWLQKNLSNLNASPKKSSRSFINEYRVAKDYKRGIYNLGATATKEPNDADTSKKKSSEKKSSGCFITTAVCKCFGKPDDCYELTMFRGFRDNWLTQQPDGDALVSEYYAIAPTIVNRIDQMVSSADIYQQIWQRYLAPCLKHLEQGENEACKERYIDMVRTLKAQYC